MQGSKKQATDSLTHSLRRSLERGEGGGDGSSGQRGDLGGLPSPLVVLCAGIIYSAQFLLSAPQKWKLDFGLFVSCCS